jgi:A118 family predicted phage portal protein
MKSEQAGCADVIRTGSSVPLFSILTPNIQNSIDPVSGLGMSVFADAIDCLKGVDLAFNNFCRDIKLGGKKVFINQSLINRDDSGNVFTPDDVAQQLFVTIGDGDFAENPMITEHNPALRCAENAEAVQSQLSYLSFRCGLGTHHYTFSENMGRSKLTATQYMGERQDMRQNAAKHQKNAKKFLCGVVRALLFVGSDVLGADIDKNASISVGFDDTYFADTDSIRRRDLEELEAGVITAEEYRRKWIDGGENG